MYSGSLTLYRVWHLGNMEQRSMHDQPEEILAAAGLDPSTPTTGLRTLMTPAGAIATIAPSAPEAVAMVRTS